ncbi:hypothetical protein BT69DRAFT_231108 [Atractiella rhizophila]|nr:hypothetical protein BT69DRAFT_231108 [Atractiella rhizophila]
MNTKETLYQRPLSPPRAYHDRSRTRDSQDSQRPRQRKSDYMGNDSNSERRRYIPEYRGHHNRERSPPRRGYESWERRNTHRTLNHGADERNTSLETRSGRWNREIMCARCHRWKQRSEFSTNQLDKLRHKIEPSLSCRKCTEEERKHNEVRQCSVCEQELSVHNFAGNNRNGSRATCWSCFKNKQNEPDDPRDEWGSEDSTDDEKREGTRVNPDSYL